MNSLLEDAGYQAITANDAREAIELQRRQPADMVITDIFMPNQDAGSDGQRRAAQAGFDRHFGKPDDRLVAEPPRQGERAPGRREGLALASELMREPPLVDLVVDMDAERAHVRDPAPRHRALR